MLYQLPKILLYSRIILSILVVSLSIFSVNNAALFVLIILYTGIISDIFDGIIARRLNISTTDFRVHDTIIDLLFYTSLFYFVFTANPVIILSNILQIMIILSLELCMYIISLVRFKKLPSPHAILSKCWGVYMVIELSLIILEVQGNHFTIALYFGILVHLERVLIYITLRNWEHDIPTLIHAYKIRQGKKIKRAKIFNG